MAKEQMRGAARRNYSKKLINYTEDQAEAELAEIRWGDSDRQACPKCGLFDSHYRIRTRRQWRCKNAQCVCTFSVTSGSRFDSSKLTYRQLLALAVAFEGSPKGITLVRTAREVGITEKCAHQNLMKIREALRDFADKRPMRGLVHIDGGHFAGKLRKSMRRFKADVNSVLSKHGTAAARARIQGRAINANTPGNLRRAKNKRVVIVLAEALPASNIFAQGHDETRRGIGRVIVASCYSENMENVRELVHKYIEPGTVIYTDENAAYARLGDDDEYKHYVVKHADGYCSPEGVTDNLAESFFARMRRAEHGTHHGYRPHTLELYAWESAWREMNRHETQESNVRQVVERMLSPGYSREWRNYHGGEKRKSRRCVRRERVMARPS